jgi:hypothetical protein
MAVRETAGIKKASRHGLWITADTMGITRPMDVEDHAQATSRLRG